MYTDKTVSNVRTSKIISKYLSLLKDMHDYIMSNTIQSPNKSNNEKLARFTWMLRQNQTIMQIMLYYWVRPSASHIAPTLQLSFSIFRRPYFLCTTGGDIGTQDHLDVFYSFVYIVYTLYTSYNTASESIIGMGIDRNYFCNHSFSLSCSSRIREGSRRFRDFTVSSSANGRSASLCSPL